MLLLRWTIPAFVVAMLAWAEPALALLIATDDATQATYDTGGWTTGDNGGSGFGAWTLTTPTNSGTFVGSSNDIRTIFTNNDAWGLFADNGATAAAVRPFSNSLVPGWVFSIDMDNGAVQNGGTVGFSLRNASGATQIVAVRPTIQPVPGAPGGQDAGSAAS